MAEQEEAVVVSGRHLTSYSVYDVYDILRVGRHMADMPWIGGVMVQTNKETVLSGQPSGQFSAQ